MVMVVMDPDLPMLASFRVLLHMFSGSCFRTSTMHTRCAGSSLSQVVIPVLYGVAALARCMPLVVYIFRHGVCVDDRWA